LLKKFEIEPQTVNFDLIAACGFLLSDGSSEDKLQVLSLILDHSGEAKVNSISGQFQEFWATLVYLVI